jgi:serine/threonine protein kinase
MLALKQVHSSGLVHRDIKPENIFVSKKSNRLQLGDFGLAKSINVVEKDMPKS